MQTPATTVMGAEGREAANASQLYRQYCRPEMGAVLSALRLDVCYRSARGNYLTYVDGEREVEVLDMLGGYGALVLEHNHPELVQLVKDLLDSNVPFHAQASVRPASALLAERLSELVSFSAEEAFVATFQSSGAEVVEAAIKHAALERNHRADDASRAVRHNFDELVRRLGSDADVEGAPPSLRGGSGGATTLRELRNAVLKSNESVFSTPPVYFAVEGSFHGKTVGALQLTANPRYREPFRDLGPPVRFLSRDDPAEISRAVAEATLSYYDVELAADGRARLAERRWVRAAACFVEPIQGEGGIHPLSKAYLQELRRVCSSVNVPLVIDEIQCGMGRTGTFLYSRQLGVGGDYYLLSKGLGGGLAKIAALLVSRRRYCPEFSLLHTSTFAEDELSSAVALRTLDILSRNGGSLLDACREKGERLREGLRAVQGRYPDVIREVRGEGLMVGVEFRDQSDARSNVLRQLSASGDLVYCVAGHLLHEHRVRVAPTLNHGWTLRLEPSLAIGRDEIDRLVSAIEGVASRIHHQDAFGLCKFIAGMESPDEPSPVRDFRSGTRPRYSSTAKKRVAFLGHLIESKHLLEYEESFRDMPPDRLDAFLRAIEPRLSSVLMSSVDVRSATGERVGLDFIGMTIASHRVVELMRSGELDLLRRLIDEAVELARDRGCSVLGLGQYSSIITHNGTDLVADGVAITSGNSLTVAMGVERLLKAAADEGVKADSSTLGVVGAGGNIASAFASVMSGAVRRVVLFGRPGQESQEKCFRTAFRIYGELLDAFRAGGLQEGTADWIRHTSAARAILDRPVRHDDGQVLFFNLREELGEDVFVRVASDLEPLSTCALVVAAASAAEPFLGPEHFAPGAVVCDLAVPLNTLPAVARARPDVRLTRGGIVKLPHGEELGVRGFPLARGRVYACMAETILLGIAGVEGDFSCGDLERRKVAQIRELARVHGFELDGSS